MISRWANALEVRVETDTDFPQLISIYETELHPPACVDLSRAQKNVVLVGLLKHSLYELDNVDGSWSDEQFEVYDSIVCLIRHLSSDQ